MGKLTTAQQQWLEALGVKKFGNMEAPAAKTTGLAAGLAAVGLKPDAKTAPAKSSSSANDVFALGETTSAETKHTRKTPFGPRVPPVDDSDPVAPKVNTGMPHTDHDHLVDIHDREKDIHEQMLWMEVRKSAYYVDNGIVSLKVLPEDMNMDIVTLTVIKMRLKFTGGRKHTVMMNTVTLSGGGGRAMKYERRNGFIIPLDNNGEPSYDEYNTPNVIICAKWVDGEIAERKQQRQDSAELVDTMGNAWGGLAGNLSSGGVKSTSTGGSPLPRVGRKGRAGATGTSPAGMGTKKGNLTGGKPGGSSNKLPAGGATGKTTGGGGGGGGKPPVAKGDGSPPVSMKLNESPKGKKGSQGGGGGGAVKPAAKRISKTTADDGGASPKDGGKKTGKPGGKKGGSSFKGGKGEADPQMVSNKQDGNSNKKVGKPTPNQGVPGKTAGKPAGKTAPATGPAVSKTTDPSKPATDPTKPATDPAKPPTGTDKPPTSPDKPPTGPDKPPLKTRPSATVIDRNKLPRKHGKAGDFLMATIENMHATGQSESQIVAKMNSLGHEAHPVKHSYPGWQQVDLYPGTQGRAIGYRVGFQITKDGPKFRILVKGEY